MHAARSRVGFPSCNAASRLTRGLGLARAGDARGGRKRRQGNARTSRSCLRLPPTRRVGLGSDRKGLGSNSARIEKDSDETQFEPDSSQTELSSNAGTEGARVNDTRGVSSRASGAKGVASPPLPLRRLLLPSVEPVGLPRTGSEAVADVFPFDFNSLMDFRRLLSFPEPLLGQFMCFLRTTFNGI